MKYYVTDIPWAAGLPNGTEILPTETPDNKSGNWFTKLDKTPLFEEEPSVKFKLFPNEFKTIK